MPIKQGTKTIIKVGLINRGKVKYMLQQFGLIVFLWIAFSSMEKANAQNKDGEIPKYQYSGMDVSFGVKTTYLKSTIDELDGNTLVAPGGNVGVLLGNSFSTFLIKPFGLYTGTGNIDRNINLYSFEIENNTYLIRGLIQKASQIDLYSTLGLSYNSYKFFGPYTSNDRNVATDNQDKRYSAKVEKLLMMVGLGVEYKIKTSNNDEFIHLFFTTKYQLPMQVSTRNKAFERTEFNKNFDVSFGIRFGFMKSNRDFHKRI